MPSANIAVTASADDALQSPDTTVSLATPSLNLNNASVWGGFRFQNVTINAGSTINSATIEIERGGTASVNADIYGEDSDDAPAFAATTNNLSGRTRTTAVVNWNASLGGASGSRFDSPAIATIIQEIVDRPGWASGHDIVILFDCLGGGIAIRTYDNAAGDAAVLKLNWTESNSPPTLALNTADDSDVSSMPSLAFTGTDAQGDTVRYQVQISDSSDFAGGSNLRDNVNYLQSPPGGLHPNGINELNWLGNWQVDDRFGQSFTAAGGILDKIVLAIGIDEPDTDGLCLVRVYEHAGTFGTTSAPLNAAARNDTPTPGWLAQSESIHIDVVNGPTGWLTFDFLGANRIYLTAGQHYIWISDWQPTAGIYTNTIEYSADTTPTHSGNAYVDGDSVNIGPRTDFDVYFGLFEESVLIDAVSGTDSGFAGTPDNTDPYTSAQQVTYTVQPSDNLVVGVVYYWRARGLDPSGSNSWGDWSATREFTVTSAAVAVDTVTSTATVYAPTLIPGSVTVALGSIASTATVYAPAFSSATVTIAPNLVTSAEVVYAPAVVTTLTVTPNFVSGSSVVHAPLVINGWAILANTIASAALVYQPVITTGSVTVAPNLVASTGVVYAPAVTLPSAPTIAPDFIAGASIVYQVILSLYAVSVDRTLYVDVEERIYAVEA
jgi:hypothetical protein